MSSPFSRASSWPSGPSQRGAMSPLGSPGPCAAWAARSGPPDRGTAWRARQGWGGRPAPPSSLRLRTPTATGCSLPQSSSRHSAARAWPSSSRTRSCTSWRGGSTRAAKARSITSSSSRASPLATPWRGRPCSSTSWRASALRSGRTSLHFSAAASTLTRSTRGRWAVRTSPLPSGRSTPPTTSTGPCSPRSRSQCCWITPASTRRPARSATAASSTPSRSSTPRRRTMAAARQ
mmetsp:Transcript_64894/g.173028  ORF Transcript_64894/g.173028 Transcript_64894/m.173028 type:complete len:234 (+) Transcript_64894:712-1413(+)